MKIAILSESFLIGGLETRLKSMAKYIIQQGHEVCLITQRMDGSAHTSLPFKTIYIVNFDNAESVKAALMAASPDVADIHPFSSIPTGATACRELDIPYSVTIHGVYMNSNYVLHLQNADRVFAVSEEVKTQVLRFAPGLNVTILKNGVDMETFRPVDIGRQFCIAYISRLDTNKKNGIIHAAGLVAQKPGAKLHIIGNGPVEGELRQILPTVEFRGYVEDIAGYFRDNTGVYSAVGGMGRAIVEGMAMKMPVVIMSYDGAKGHVTPFNFYDFARNNFSGRGMPNIERLSDLNTDYTEALYEMVCEEYDIRKITEEYLSIASKMIRS